MISRSTDIKAALRSRQRGFLLNPFRFGGGGGGGATDPDWSSVSLLLKATGHIFDASSIANTISTADIGGVTISTSVTQFGENSIYFPAEAAGWLTVQNDSQFNFGANDFTVEAFVRPIGSGEMGVFWKRGNSGSYTGLGIAVRNNRLYILGSYNNVSWAINGSFSNGPTPIPDGVFTHIAVSRVGSFMRCFVGGAIDQSFTVGTSALMSNTSPVSIGATAANGAGQYSGHVYGLRVTTGVGRYSAAFTPPMAPFPNS